MTYIISLRPTKSHLQVIHARILEHSSYTMDQEDQPMKGPREEDIKDAPILTRPPWAHGKKSPPDFPPIGCKCWERLRVFWWTVIYTVMTLFDS